MKNLEDLKEDVYKLAKENIWVHNLVRRYEKKDCTWEECMTIGVLILADQCKRLEKLAIDAANCRPNPPIFIKGELVDN